MNQRVEDSAENRTARGRKIMGGVISVVFLLSILVCVICNLAINRQITWGWYPVTSVIFVWIITMPVLLCKKRGMGLSLTALSLTILPYLWALERIIGEKDLIMPIGIRVSIIGLVYLWAVYFIFSVIKVRKYTAGAISALLLIPLSIGINEMVNYMLGQPPFWNWSIWTILSYLAVIAAALIFILTGLVVRLAKEKQSN